MIDANINLENSTTSTETEETVGKELILEQVQYTDNLDSVNINYLTYLIVG